MLLSGTKHSLGTVPYTEASALLATARQNLRDVKSCEQVLRKVPVISSDALTQVELRTHFWDFLGWAMNGYHIMRYHTLVEKDKTFFLWLLHSKRAEIPIKFLRTQDVLISHNFACLSKTPTRREIRHQTDLILTYLIQIDFEFSNCGFCIPSASTLVHSCYSSSSATWRWRVSTRASIGGLWE